MLWEHEPQASVSTAFLSFPKLSRVFLLLDRNTKKMFSISFRKYPTVTNARDYDNFFVFLSSYRNTIFNQSARIFSLDYFLILCINIIISLGWSG